jgi:UDP-2,3-diacylglucosamine pyrophosphatase LpxH
VRSVFLGDSHLTSPPGPRHAVVLELLRNLDADRLFVVGDLVQFLIGTPGLRRSHAAAVLDRLEQLARQGVMVTYLEGNHDFGLRPILDPAIEVWTGPGEVQCDGLRVHVAHGDQVQFQDLGYALLRPTVRSRAFRWVLRLAGEGRMQAVGERGARVSADLGLGRGRSWRPQKKAYVRRLGVHGVDLVVLGHSHRLATERIGDARVVQTGACDERAQHVVVDGHQLQLWSGGQCLRSVDVLE